MSDHYMDLFATLDDTDIESEIEVRQHETEGITLRPYQVDAVDAIFEAFKEYDSTLCEMATGLGKSVVFSEVMRRWDRSQRILVLAHREELIFQASAHARNAFLSAGIEMGNHRARKEDVVVSTVQTLNATPKCRSCFGEGCDACDHNGRARRMRKFNPVDFGLIIVDEAHHCHVPGTLVSTSSGYVPIESMSAGQRVRTWNGETFTESVVVRRFGRAYDGPVLEITTTIGVVTVTPNHRMYSNGKLVESSSLAEGDSISVPAVRRNDYRPIRPADALSVESSGNEALPGVLARDARRRTPIAQTGASGGTGRLRRMRQGDVEEVAGGPYEHPHGQQCDAAARSSCGRHEEAVEEQAISPTSFGADDQQKPNALRYVTKEDAENHFKFDGSRQAGSLWQHAPVRQRREGNTYGIARTEPVSVGHIQYDSCSRGRRAATSLQSGCSVAEVEDWPGTRRNLSRITEGGRRTEGRAAVADRLEDSPADERRGGISEARITSIRVRNYTGFVYDIEVADTHNYLANGLLSSNSTAKTYRRTLKWFRKNPDLKILFVTATPNRADGTGLHNVCESVAYQMGLKTAIHEAWLCPIRQRFVQVDSLDLSSVKTSKGDLAKGELERAFLGETTKEEEELLHSITYPCLQEADGKPLLVFASGIDHAQKLTAAFNAYDNVTAEMVIGTTDTDERKRIIDRYKSGETQVLVGVGCFTEGFDAPNTAVCGIARPTKSTPLYLQMIGRATRPEPGIVDGPETAEDRRGAIAASGKPQCVILDFVGNSGHHKLISVADVLAGKDVDEHDLEEAVETAKQTDGPVDIEELIEKAKQAREEREERERKREEERQKRISTRHKAETGDYSADDVDLFSGRRFNPYHDYNPGPAQATQAQVYRLMKLGVSAEDATGYSKRQASTVISKMEAGNGSGGDWVLPFGSNRGRKLKDLPPEIVANLKRNFRRDDLQRNIAIMEEAHHTVQQ